MEKNKSMRGLLREKTNRDVVIKYMFIKAMEERCDDKYLDMMYRINCKNIRLRYSLLTEDERTKIENDIKNQIVAGEVNLSEEAVKWHREGLNAEYIEHLNKIKSDKSKREEH